jgi:hypothetical protein
MQRSSKGSSSGLGGRKGAEQTGNLVTARVAVGMRGGARESCSGMVPSRVRRALGEPWSGGIEEGRHRPETHQTAESSSDSRRGGRTRATFKIKSIRGGCRARRGREDLTSPVLERAGSGREDAAEQRRPQPLGNERGREQRRGRATGVEDRTGRVIGTNPTRLG